MLLEEVALEPCTSWIRAEQSVNDGSPSGFTALNAPSRGTDPRFSPSFSVLELAGVDDGDLVVMGAPPDFLFDDGGRIRVFVHPDWVGRGLRGCDVVEGPSVFPLSSSRTVQLGLSEYALKLAYPGMLGRISRSMTEEHIGLALEVSGILESKVAEGGCLGLMDFMPKLCGVVFRRGSFETGYAVRGHARCMLDEPSYPVLPAFALTSVDKSRPSDPPLLCQIMARKEDAASWLAGNLLLPLTDVFFARAFDEGLLLEMHSQNVLVQFDSCWDVRKIILRDLESADKDCVIRRALKGKPPFYSLIAQVLAGEGSRLSQET